MGLGLGSGLGIRVRFRLRLRFGLRVRVRVRVRPRLRPPEEAARPGVVLEAHAVQGGVGVVRQQRVRAERVKQLLAVPASRWHGGRWVCARARMGRGWAAGDTLYRWWR